MAKTVNINYTRNTTYIITHTYQKSGVPATTGMTLFFTVKAAQFDSDTADGTAIIKKTIPMAGNPVTLITVNPEDVADTITPGVYFFNILVKESDGPPKVIYPCVSGTFTIIGEPTNREA